MDNSEYLYFVEEITDSMLGKNTFDLTYRDSFFFKRNITDIPIN
jgi:hypothetical protein